jgi:hypothetical protein
MVDTPVLEAGAVRCESSSLSVPTILSDSSRIVPRSRAADESHDAVQ